MNNVVQISNVSERYAPEGQDLVCADALDEYTEDSSINGSISPAKRLRRRC